MRVTAAILALSIGLPAFAHHSFSAEYDANKPVNVQGVVTKLAWVNPHAYVTIAATDSAGATQQSRGEGGPLSYLTDSGWSPEMLQQLVKSHDVVVVSGYRGRATSTPGNRMWVKTIELPDGRRLVFN